MLRKRKNIVKKAILSVFLLISVPVICFAQETASADTVQPANAEILTTVSSTEESVPSWKDDWSLSVEPFAGIRYGYLGEHFYELDTDNEYKQLSYLEWEIKPAFTYGANISASYKKIGLSTYIKSALTARCGNMYDSDWMDLDDVKNDYSISENTLSSLIEAGAAANYSFKPLSWLKIGPEVSFDYNYISFEARNGYGWYGDYDNSSTHTNVSYDSADATYYASGSLCGIDYNRTSFLTWIGFNSVFTPFDRWDFGFSGAIALYSFEYAYDHHYSSYDYNQGYYLDVVESFFSRVKGNLYALFSINDIFAVKLDISGMVGWPVKGSTYEAYYDSSTGTYPTYYIESGYKSGISTYYAECSLGCRISLF